MNNENNKLCLPRVILNRIDKNINLKPDITEDGNDLNDKAQFENNVNTVPFELAEVYCNLFHIEKVWSMSKEEHATFEVLNEINVGSNTTNTEILNAIPENTNDCIVPNTKHEENSNTFNIEKDLILLKDETEDFKKVNGIETGLNIVSSCNNKHFDILRHLPQILVENGGNPVYFSDHQRQYKCPLCFRNLNGVQKLNLSNEMPSSICDCGLVIYQGLDVENDKSCNNTVNPKKEPQSNIGEKFCDSSSVDNENNILKSKDIFCEAQHKTYLDKSKEKPIHMASHEYSARNDNGVITSTVNENEVMILKEFYFKTGYLVKVKVEEPETLENIHSSEEDIAEYDTSLYVVQDAYMSENSRLSTHPEIKKMVGGKNRKNKDNIGKISKFDCSQCSSVIDKQIEGKKLTRTLNKNGIDSNHNVLTEKANNKVSTGEMQKFSRKKYAKIDNSYNINMPELSKAVEKNHAIIIKKDAIKTESDKKNNDMNDCRVKNKDKKSFLSISAKKKHFKQPRLVLKKIDSKKINSIVKCTVNEYKNKYMKKYINYIEKDSLNAPTIKTEELKEKLNLKCKDTKKINRKTLKSKDIKIENGGILKEEKDKTNVNKKGIRCSSRQRIKPFCFPTYDHHGRFIHKDVWSSMSERDLKVSQIKLEKLE